MFTNGPATFGAEVRALLATAGVGLEETLVDTLLHTRAQLRGLGLADGRTVALAVLYAGLPRHQASGLPAQLGCELDEQQILRVDELNHTTVRACTRRATTAPCCTSWPTPSGWATGWGPNFSLRRAPDYGGVRNAVLCAVHCVVGPLLLAW